MDSIPRISDPVTAGIVSGVVVLGFQVLLVKTGRYLKQLADTRRVRAWLTSERSPNTARAAGTEQRGAA